MEKAFNSSKNLSQKGLTWKVKNSIKETREALKAKANISNILKNILEKRDLYTLKIEEYLNPSLRNQTPDPLIINDMKKGVDYVYSNILKKKK